MVSVARPLDIAIGLETEFEECSTRFPHQTFFHLWRCTKVIDTTVIRFDYWDFMKALLLWITLAECIHYVLATYQLICYNLLSIL